MTIWCSTPCMWLRNGPQNQNRGHTRRQAGRRGSCCPVFVATFTHMAYCHGFSLSFCPSGTVAAQQRHSSGTAPVKPGSYDPTHAGSVRYRSATHTNRTPFFSKTAPPTHAHRTPERTEQFTGRQAMPQACVRKERQSGQGSHTPAARATGWKRNGPHTPRGRAVLPRKES